MPLISAIIPMYRDAERALAAIDALCCCELPPDYRLEIVVVDDGSDDGSAERVASQAGATVQLVRHPSNCGRVKSRNDGVRASKGEYLLFLDCDCTPASVDFLLEHLASLAHGDVSMGSLQGDTRGFWHDYQAWAARRRESWGELHAPLRLSAANVMLRRASFVAVGGFDEAYRGYGFEDRALALRLQAQGMRLRWSPRALAQHEDALSLHEVCAKMRAAAGGNGRHFSCEFPSAYQRLGYAAMDARLHPWLTLPCALIKQCLPSMIDWLERRLEQPRWPFAWRACAVKLLAASSYLVGSRAAACDEDSAL